MTLYAFALRRRLALAGAAMLADPPRHGRLTISLGLCLLLTGCSSARMTMTERSAPEQQLLVRSLERAVARLDVTRLAGKRVAFDLYGLTKDDFFAREFVKARLQKRGVRIVSNQDAELRLVAFASVLAVDSAETLLGIPALPLPGLSLQTPEVAIAKWVRNRGQSEVQAYLFDAASGQFMEELPMGVGRSKYDRFILLIGIIFTVSDLEKRSSPSP